MTTGVELTAKAAEVFGILLELRALDGTIDRQELARRLGIWRDDPHARNLRVLATVLNVAAAADATADEPTLTAEDWRRIVIKTTGEPVQTPRQPPIIVPRLDNRWALQWLRQEC